MSHHVKSLTRRLPYLGPACWIATLQFFVAQVAAAMGTRSAYNWATDTISHLGFTQCLAFDHGYVCSPLHAFYNLSLVGLGLIVAAGALLLYHQFRSTRATLVGFTVVAIGGFGTMLAGLFPADTILLLHRSGAGLSLVGGLAGVLVLSMALQEVPRTVRYVLLGNGLLAIGGLALLSLAFFLDWNFKGAAERLLSYPQVVSLIVLGGYVLLQRERAPPSPSADAPA